MHTTSLIPTRLLLGFLLAGLLLLGSGCGLFSNSPELTDDTRVAKASVKGSKLTVKFSAPLDLTQQPTPELFTVDVDGSRVPVKSVTASKTAVGLHLQNPARHGDRVLLSFTNTDTANIQLRTVNQAPVSDFAGLLAKNRTLHPYERYVTLTVLGLLAASPFIALAVAITQSAWLQNLRQRKDRHRAHH